MKYAGSVRFSICTLHTKFGDCRAKKLRELSQEFCQSFAHMVVTQESVEELNGGREPR